METSIYTKEGKVNGKITLPEEVFGVKWNADLVHQVVHSLESAARIPYAHTKDRGEVRGGGKKPWQQKGTGRARHGSTRSPIWIGGGVAHGPRNDKNYDRKVNKKVKDKVLSMILSAKYKDGEIIFVDTLSFTAPKTKDAITFVNALGAVKDFSTIKSKRKNAFCLAIPAKDRNTEKSFANIGKAIVSEIRNINPLDILKHKFLIIENPEVSIPMIKSRLLK